MNCFLAITLAAAVVGCVSHSPPSAVSDGGLDPNTFYLPGTDTPLETGGEVVTFNFPDRNRAVRRLAASCPGRGAIRLGRLWFLTIEYPGRPRLPAEVGMYGLARQSLSQLLRELLSEH
jgi:hypothetical protein